MNPSRPRSSERERGLLAVVVVGVLVLVTATSIGPISSWAAGITPPPAFEGPPTIAPAIVVPSASAAVPMAVVPDVDITPPTVAAPQRHLLAPSTLGTTISVVLSWSATDASGINSYEAQLLTFPGPITSNLILAAPTDTSVIGSLKVGRSYRLSVRATDVRGNTSEWVTGKAFAIIKTEQSAAAVKYHGVWATSKASSASGGSFKRTSGRGAYATFTFTGSEISIVARTGPVFGKANVYLDGKFVKTINLYHAGSNVNRRIVLVKGLSSKSHTIKIVRATKVIDIDAFVRVAP